MPSSRISKIASALGFATLFLLPTGILLPNAARQESANTQENAPPAQPQEPPAQAPPAQEPQSQAAESEEPPAPAANYDKAIFQNPISSDQLAFLNQFAGVPSKDLVRDKQFHKLMPSVIPNCTFHYGRDMPLSDALEMILKGSPRRARIRDGRYLLVSGLNAPYLAGKVFLWIDMQAGLGLGGFYFYPTNGEPTPVLNVFSKQVSEKTLGMSQLPPPFWRT